MLSIRKKTLPEKMQQHMEIDETVKIIMNKTI